MTGGRLFERWRRLRVRIAVQVSVLVAVMAVLLGSGTYVTVRAVLLAERERNASDQVEANARLLAGELRSTAIGETELLATLRPRERSRPLLNRDGEWFSASLQLAPESIPADLRTRALAGESVRQRFVFDGETLLGYGVPIGGGDTYFEVFSLRDTNATLATLRATLVAGAVASVVIGGFVGTTIARRAVRPLDRVSETAELIAAGALDSRLSVRVDGDLTRVASSFNAMADALEARIETESRLASDASHELRSPLTTLLVSAAVLDQRRDELSDDAREALDNLNADLERFGRLVNDMIEIAKHDAGTAMPATSLQPVRAARFVTSTLRRLRREEVPVDAAGAEEALVEISEHHLQRAIQNLVENAELHAGGLERVSVLADDHRVVLRFDDRGPGVPEADRQRIFERFSRGTASRRTTSGPAPGSGLGLALTAGIVRSNGGTIRCVDNPGGGARFEIDLPRAAS